MFNGRNRLTFYILIVKTKYRTLGIRDWVLRDWKKESLKKFLQFLLPASSARSNLTEHNLPSLKIF